jgi:hypothetical protein
MMIDLSHRWGTDLSVGSTGDLAVASGASLGQQRLLRRLLTNAGDYIWQRNYGAGLARFVGGPSAPSQIRALVRGQMVRERAVLRSPEPAINVVEGSGVQSNALLLGIRYTDSSDRTPQLLEFSVRG